MAYYFQETKGNSNNCFVLLLLLITINFVLLLELYATTPPTSSSTASSSPSSSPTVKPTTTPTASPSVLTSVILTYTVIPRGTLSVTTSGTALPCPSFHCSYTGTATSTVISTFTTTSTSTYSGTDPAGHALVAPSSTAIVNTITTTDRQCLEEKSINKR